MSRPPLDRPIDLELRDIVASGESWRCTARVPEDLLYFDGHFDELPVLAGVAQLEAVARCVADAWPDKPTIRRYSRVKFRQMIGPGDSLELELRCSGNKGTFSIRRGGELCTQGNIELA